MGSDFETTLKHMDGLAFQVEMGNHSFVIDSKKTAMGGRDRGPSSKGLLLPALGGCTGMDVASILKKMKVPFTSFQVDVTGETNDEHPIHFTSLHIVYTVRGPDLSEKKVARAVKLSQETYCGVSYMLKQTCEITHEIVIEGDREKQT